MYFALEVAILGCSLVKHSQGILGIIVKLQETRHETNFY
jgi:hypothetical protein